MKKLVLILLGILFLVIDNSVAPFFAIKGVYPSLLFTFAICFSIVNRGWDAIGIGVFIGILQDLYFAQGFGYNTLINLLLCFGVALLAENIFRHKRFVPILIVGGITIIKYFSICIVTNMVGIKVPIDFGILIMAIYNIIVAFFMYQWVYDISNKDYMKSQWKFNK